jgi:hypothetical protein
MGLYLVVKGYRKRKKEDRLVRYYSACRDTEISPFYVNYDRL